MICLLACTAIAFIINKRNKNTILSCCIFITLYRERNARREVDTRDSDLVRIPASSAMPSASAPHYTVINFQGDDVTRADTQERRVEEERQWQAMLGMEFLYPRTEEEFSVIPGYVHAPVPSVMSSPTDNARDGVLVPQNGRRVFSNTWLAMRMFCLFCNVFSH